MIPAGRIKWWLMFVFLLTGTYSFSRQLQQQEGWITGQVTDKETEETLPGANIYLKHNMAIGTVSDFNGHYRLKVPAGTFTVICSYTGMKTIEKEVTVKEGQQVSLNFRMEIFSKQFKEVVVKAGKFDRKIEEQTVSIEVMKARLIEERNTTNISTALNLIPGVNIIDEEPQIRGGSGFTFGVGSKVAVFIDDLPIITGDNGKPNWSLIPVENINQVEVVKGASSVLSGSAALSGAIYIHTQFPGIEPETRIKVFGGTYSPPRAPADKWWNGLNWSSGLTFQHSRQINHNRTDLVVGAFLQREGNYIGAPKPSPLVDVDNELTDKDMTNYHARVNINLRHRSKKVNGLSYGVNGNFMYSETARPLAWLNDTNYFYRAYPDAIIKGKNITYYFDPFIKYVSALGFKHEFINRLMVSNSDNINDQSNDVFMMFNQYQFSKSFANLGHLDFIGGISSNYTHSNANMYAASGSPQNYVWNTSIFTEIEKNFSGILNLSGGVRIEHFILNDSIRDIQPVIRAGATLKVGRETYLRTSLGQGYRFPTITERFIRTNAGSIGVFDNPELMPEKSWNAEIGIKQGFKFSHFYGFLDVAYFYQIYENTIQYLFGFWDPTYQFAIAGFKFVNTGRSRINGLDISVNGTSKTSHHWQINYLIGYTYVMPVAEEPDLVYAHDYNPGGHTEFSYNSTSVDPSKGILKYRYLHTAKANLDISWKNLTVGGSFKYFSKIVNLDKAIFDFEDATTNTGGTLQPILYRKYFYNHNNGNAIFDMRVGFTFAGIHKFALIVDNIGNRMYSLRPLKAEPMRKITLQYNLQF
jgi:iron complex outermembrane receptor protein